MKRLLDAFLEAGVYSTWFITHPTEMLDDLRSHSDTVELGIHPNFLVGSSHGAIASEVIDSCMRLVPEARTMRTHCLVQSTPILQEVVDRSPIELDTSLYLRNAKGVLPSVLPLDHGRAITRVPYVWEDDLEFFAATPAWDARTFLDGRMDTDEVTVIDVHPIHYALNSCGVDNYAALKEETVDMRTVTESAATRFANSEPGTATFIDQLVREKSDGGLSMTRRLLSLVSM